MENLTLRQNERIDDLQCKGLKIIQNKDWFCFGMDAVLLANYCDIKKNSTVVDLGTGTGIIPVLLCGKNEVKKIYAVEIQEEVAEMANRTVLLNNLEEKIEIVNIDLKEAVEKLGVNKFDVVTSNPPYMNCGSGLQNKQDKKTISRHEVKCDLEDVIKVASRLLKHNGKFFLVHRPNRIVDIFTLLRQYKLEPKNIRFIYPKVGERPNLVLIKSIKASKPDLKFEEPLYVYDDRGNYTDEILKIYGMDKEVKEDKNG
ncbi:methyltransferase small [Gottschalkia acidurici 9a]|uniref:Methyltransferase small n=1 Tax=Gottschalkia acidurici (strain ATCC 7906 / DSM 604 / BCRC 14475 / CIP 104303 / KCTC 5404 / NCIMB 10678 / 9a) TaxID=1128398 RepID=K0AWP5_GOTA9|nr:tRNA1(Val) (adenine(37)-N6)-methyltransferase [Gottschalkia acidurici]AFS77197.1 methyltransferase small [Gottschalkia acidurici 9a]